MAPTGHQCKQRRVFVVLPAYNEEACLDRLLQRIHETLCGAGLSYQIIVVDDGSTDSTPDIARTWAEKIPLTLKQHSLNQGLGATIRDGLREAADRSNADDLIVTMDADETHQPGLMVRMAWLICEGHDVVIASRYQRGSRTVGVPLVRRFLSYMGSVVFRVLFPIRGVKDFTCGYRAYEASVIQRAIEQYGEDFFSQDGFECMVDILLKLRRMNLIFGEVPMVLRYDLKQGASKMRIGPTILTTLGLLAKRRLSV